jgi:hypothetical protein
LQIVMELNGLWRSTWLFNQSDEQGSDEQTAPEPDSTEVAGSTWTAAREQPACETGNAREPEQP